MKREYVVLVVALATFVAAVVVGCGNFERSAQPDQGDVAKGSYAPPVSERMRTEDEYDRASTVTADATTTGYHRTVAGLTDITMTRMVIRTAQVSVEVEECDPVLDSLNAIAEAFDGFLAASQITQGYGGKRGSAAIRVPAENFSSALEAILALGEVESKSISGDDVTEEYYDLSARLNNARATEKRYLEILRSAHTVKDILEVEAQIDQIRERIERFEGRMRFLEDNVALSTISVDFHEPQAVYSKGGGVFRKLGRALEDAFEAFVDVVSGVIVFLGAAVPLGLIGLFIAWLIVKMVRRGWFSWLGKKKIEAGSA
jgi:hypothetical protein